MQRQSVLRELDKTIIATDEEVINDTLPMNADTLAGHPIEYFASKTEINQAINHYIASILGTSY